MVVDFNGKKVYFNGEINDTFDVHGPYCKEIEVHGSDNNGVEYSAMGMELDGEIDEIDESTIEIVDTEIEYLESLVDNNPDDGSWVGR